MSKQVAVRLEGVTKRFGAITAVNDVTLDVHQGEFLTLLGPSGCGKTTLLNMIAGFLDPDEGDVFIAGEKVTEVPTFRRDIGMVFQNYALFPHMSVFENVAFGLKMRSVPDAKVRSGVEEALDIVRLTDYGERKPHELSGGQQQRIALARAIVINPRVLLLDEPLSALDKNLRTSMQVELKEIQRRIGITTIFVTHDQGEALSLSDRIAVISEGVIQQVSGPDDTYRKPQNSFVASFIGDINRVEGTIAKVNKTSIEVELGDGTEISAPANGAFSSGCGNLVWVFVRPEAMQLTKDNSSGAIKGKIHAHVYQGAHVEIYVETAIGPIHLRTTDYTAMERWPVGAAVRVAIDRGEALVFPRDI